MFRPAFCGLSRQGRAKSMGSLALHLVTEGLGRFGLVERQRRAFGLFGHTGLHSANDMHFAGFAIKTQREFLVVVD